MPMSESYWILEYISEKETKALCWVHADPGGKIPDWLANYAMVDLPYKMMKGLKEIVE
jgi:hypothetical protein